MTKDDGVRGPRPRIDTMADLSEAIGVSRPTLSRYFQDPSRVSRASVDKIRRGLESVEYVPNFFATRMNRKSTGMIGVIIPYLNDLFFTRLLEAIEIAAMEAGFTVITQCSHSDVGIEARAAETFLSMNVDGALVAPLGNRSDQETYARLNARLPFLLVDSRPTFMRDADFVGTDHRQSTGMITDYLCRVGPPPVFLAMPRVNFNAVERENAYVDHMTELGHEPEVIGVGEVRPDWHFEAHGMSVLDSFFSRGKYVDRAILCANDRLAIGALAAASRHGLDPGGARRGGFRIAGHDDYPLCPFTTPPLTTIAQNVEAIGKTAVSALVNKIHGEKSGQGPMVALHDGVLKLRSSA